MITKQRYYIKDLAPGMVLGEDVISIEHRVLLAEGMKLTRRKIDLLKYSGLEAVVINKKCSGETVRQTVMRKHGGIVSSISKAFQKTKLLGKVPIEEMEEITQHAIYPLIQRPGIIGCLSLINTKDEYTYRHSVNVAIVAGIIGKWMGYEKKYLLELILAGLLHDLGKLFVPIDILNKPGKLDESEYDKIKCHPEEGYKLLAGTNVAEAVRQGVLQHHERISGQGYPHGVEGSEICDYAKIIAVADIYDAITSDRPYSPKRTPFTAIKIIVDQMLVLDPKVFSVFIENVRDSFVGSSVSLSDGSKGEIVCMKDRYSYRPIIRVSDSLLNLEKRHDIIIKEVLS